MPCCSSVGCNATIADLKCNRCLGVYYCNAECQRCDWKRHKRFCKPPIGIPEPKQTWTASLQLAPESTREIDLELFQDVREAYTTCKLMPIAFQTVVPLALSRTRKMIARGARPDVRVKSTAGSDETHTVLGAICAADVDGLEPLLTALLEADLSPPVNASAVSLVRGVAATPLASCIELCRASYAQVLLSHGADVSLPVYQDFTHGHAFPPIHALTTTLYLAPPPKG